MWRPVVTREWKEGVSLPSLVVSEGVIDQAVVSGAVVTAYEKEAKLSV